MEMFEYDYKQTTQAINFLVSTFKNLDLLDTIKILYFADRYHLRKYGKPVAGSYYVAMKKGPVNSAALDLCNKSEYFDPEQTKYFQDNIKRAGYKLTSKKSIDKHHLSESNIEALEFARNLYKELKDKNIDFISFSHIYPEWKKHETTIEKEKQPQAIMSYDDFFESPLKSDMLNLGLTQDPFELLSADELSYAKEQYSINKSLMN